MAGSIGGIGGFGGGSEIGGQNRIHQGPPPPPPPSSNQTGSNSQSGCQDGFQQSQGSQVENGQQAGQAGPPPPPPELKALFDKLKTDKQSGNSQAATEDQEKIQEFIQNLQQTQGGGQSQGMGQQSGF